MKKQGLTVILISILTFAVGCSSYKVGDKTFHSSSEALKEQTQILSHELAEITPTDTPVHGTALVLLPSDMEIRKNYIRFHGNTHGISEEHIKYMMTSIRNRFQFVADAIRK